MNVLATNYVVRTIEIKYTDIPILREAFYPTVLTVALMLQCCVRLSPSSVVVVCDVMHCG